MSQIPIEVLQCPVCHVGRLSSHSTALGDALFCGRCSLSFPVAAGTPVLLRPDNDLFDTNKYVNAARNDKSSPERRTWFPTASVNLSREQMLHRMAVELRSRPSPRILVLGAGRQRNRLQEFFHEVPELQIVATDIDLNSDVDYFCDAHDLPFADESFDGVITTAVLEHVLQPARVADEITRVLRLNGLVYSELPFMQQVHEGAYDFTRFSLSGHRRLFNAHHEIAAGMVAGPGTALVWAIEHFAAAFGPTPLAQKAARGAARLLFFWLKYFDYLLVHRPNAMDGASCTFFLGRKFAGHVSDADIISRYRGSKQIRHV